MVSGWTLQNNKVEDRWEKNTQSAADKGEKKLENTFLGQFIKPE